MRGLAMAIPFPAAFLCRLDLLFLFHQGKRKKEKGIKKTKPTENRRSCPIGRGVKEEKIKGNKKPTGLSGRQSPQRKRINKAERNMPGKAKKPYLEGTTVPLTIRIVRPSGALVRRVIVL